MDTRSGRIYSAEEAAAMADHDREYMREMMYYPTPLQRERGRVGRNDPCPCGSDKKFKKCCIGKPVTKRQYLKGEQP